MSRILANPATAGGIAASRIVRDNATMPRRNLLLLLLVSAASYVCYVQGAQNPYRRHLADGLTTIENNSLDAAPCVDLFAGAMNGMVAELKRHGDQHSQFYTAAEATALRNEIHQQIGGIGIRVVLLGDPPLPHVAGPIESGSPADLAKLKIGDCILKIDGHETTDVSLREIADSLRGEPGTTVQLSIESATDSQSRELELTRRLVQVESVLGNRRGPDGQWIFTLEDEPRIAQLRIVAFGDQTALEFATVMAFLAKQGVHGVILDLRDNAGGSLGSAVAICEMLLPAGKTIVETRGRDDELRERYVSKSDGVYREIPVAVIVNRNSASASEIIAACLQDHQRAVVVGERSFGKGTVQQMLPLGNSLLKLTWASFWRPSGANINRAAGSPETAAWGVSPDAGYEHTLTPEQYRAYREFRGLRDDSAGVNLNGKAAADFVDEAVAAAAEYLRAQLTKTPETSL
jgi:carboxyl-terminal processing protease